MRRKLFLFAGMPIVFGGIVFVGYGTCINQYYQSRAWSIESVITEFMVKNEGRFPESQQELVDKGYLKIESSAGAPTYFLKTSINNRTEWRQWPVELHRFTIFYGASKESLHAADGKLYVRDSDAELFLLDGPYNRTMEPTLRRTYRLISLKLYEQMCSEEPK